MAPQLRLRAVKGLDDVIAILEGEYEKVEQCKSDVADLGTCKDDDPEKPKPFGLSYCIIISKHPSPCI